MKKLNLVLPLLIFSWNVAFPQQPVPCSEREEFHLLDFWVGSWEVYSGDQKIGTNKIEKIMGGCAIIENWTGGRGSEGKSLFYYLPAEQTWKQVWVTENPFSNGGVKEKTHVETLDNGGSRFQGKVMAQSGTLYLDRTTLIPLANGNVEQVIEISSNDGENWREVFRGVYKPVQK